MILVTGGAGFIGSVLVKELNYGGYTDIWIVDRLESDDKWKNLRNLKFTDYIHADELAEAIDKSEIQLSNEEIKKIIKEVDYQGNGKINYSEFMAATINVSSVLNESKMWALFKQFDTDDTGFITKENMKDAFKKLGKHITDKEINEAMKQHDTTKTDVISWPEFKEMLMGE